MKNKIWLKGGLIAVGVCMILFFVYMFIYFPLMERIYLEDRGELESFSELFLIPPTMTGHIFPMLSIFIIPYGLGCEFSEQTCTSWSSTYVPGSQEWTFVDETGSYAGYCTDITLTPNEKCAERSEKIGFFALSFLLVVGYFILGSVIGLIIQERKKYVQRSKTRKNN